jgi:hypothetical protein
MNEVEHVANEIVRGLKVQNGIDFEPEDALIIARIAISVLEEIHENKVRTAFARWQRFKSEHQARGKKWLYGTGDLPDIPNMASQPLPDYLCAAMRDDASTLPSGRHGRPSLV